jgi:ABC-type multidrug transport system ATPase subunit
LLDDPLSAVDANVSKILFDECINGYLKKKIRILVTHHVHYLKKANQIILLENGEIKTKGNYDELMSSEKNMNLINNIEIERQESLKKIESTKTAYSRSSSSFRRTSSELDENVEISLLSSSAQVLESSTNHLVK